MERYLRIQIPQKNYSTTSKEVMKFDGRIFKESELKDMGDTRRVECHVKCEAYNIPKEWFEEFKLPKFSEMLKGATSSDTGNDFANIYKKGFDDCMKYIASHIHYNNCYFGSDRMHLGDTRVWSIEKNRDLLKDERIIIVNDML